MDVELGVQKENEVVQKPRVDEVDQMLLSEGRPRCRQYGGVAVLR